MALVVLALLAACAGAPEAPDAGPYGCALRLALDESSRAIGARALARINAASGCWLSENGGGVPIRVVPVVRNLKGRPVCGGTFVEHYKGKDYVTRIDISSEVPGCLDTESTAVHEIIHAMMGGKNIHSDSGVSSAKANDGTINASTLVTLCSDIDCPAFVPERGAS